MLLDIVCPHYLSAVTSLQFSHGCIEEAFRNIRVVKNPSTDKLVGTTFTFITDYTTHELFNEA